MKAIYDREMQGYFHSPIGFVFMGVFLTLACVFFALGNLLPRSGDILTFVGQMSYLYMLLCPVLTMRLLAGGEGRGTDKLLLSSPVSLKGIVGGKFLAALTIQGITTAVSLVFPLLVAVYGTLYPGEMLCGYLGFFLQGCAFLAMDLFVSSFCRGTVTAFLAAFFVNFLVWLMDLWGNSLTGFMAQCLDFLSLYVRAEPFLMGQLSFAGMVYFLSVTLIFLILTVYRLDLNRRRGV
ncbi:MAG: ABC transporter permease subunit [Clostridia bacterium]|nr:ABC transporter permease subunit [Clostridia bacterium]